MKRYELFYNELSIILKINFKNYAYNQLFEQDEKTNEWKPTEAFTELVKKFVFDTQNQIAESIKTHNEHARNNKPNLKQRKKPKQQKQPSFCETPTE